MKSVQNKNCFCNCFTNYGNPCAINFFMYCIIHELFEIYYLFLRRVRLSFVRGILHGVVCSCSRVAIRIHVVWVVTQAIHVCWVVTGGIHVAGVMHVDRVINERRGR